MLAASISLPAEMMRPLVEKWINKQDVFDEYVIKPACIHVPWKE